MGIALAGAETMLGALSGQTDSMIWWSRLTAFYGPALASLGAASSAAERARGEPGRSSRAPLLALHGLLFGHTGVVYLQECLPGVPLFSPQRLASLGLLAALLIGSLSRLGRLGRGLSWLEAGILAFGLPTLSRAAFAVPAGSFERVLAILALPIVGVVLGCTCFALGKGSNARRGLTVLAVAPAAMAIAFLSLAPSARHNRGSLFRKAEAQPRAYPTEPHSRPNIVLIVLDTLRARSLSCYGNALTTTPHIDAFAREGVLYTNFISTASWTLPTHASLFTGLYASRHGADDPPLRHWRPGSDSLPLDEQFDTLAEVLARDGYATAAFVSNLYVNRSKRLDQGFREYDASPAIGYMSLLARVAPRLSRWSIWRRVQSWLATPFHTAESIVQKAEGWLRLRRPGRPFFLFLNFMDTHSPYVPRHNLREWTMPGGGSGITDLGLPQRARGEILSGMRSITESESRQLNALYTGALAYLDHELGRLLESLRRRQDYPDTWVIVTADHGESLGEHRTLGHGVSLFQEVLHCPLIIRYPRSLAFKPGTRDDRPVQTVDIMPTILDGVGLSSPSDLDGVPIRHGRELMFAEAAIPFRASEFPNRFHRELRAVMDGRFKYIQSSSGDAELYDLVDDPGEQRNLAAAMPREAERLREKLGAWRREMEARTLRPSGTPPPLTEAQRERLRALGYVR